MRRWWIWPAGLVPAAIGLGLVLWLQSRGPTTPMLSVQVDLDTLALLAGLVISGAILWTATEWELARRRQARAVAPGLRLLDNALKFTRAGDTVEARAAEDGSAVVVELADTGAGMPADEAPQIFEELYRGQGARGIEGSGLGLALVKAVAERHGGRVAVRSRPGQGSVFSLRLPAS